MEFPFPRLRLSLMKPSVRVRPRFAALSQQRPCRQGVAVVELAVCLPLLIALLLGTIEACHMIHLKQDLSVVSYEGARVGTLPGSSRAAVEAQCELLLEDRGIAGYSVGMSADPATLDRGSLLTVTVEVPCNRNSLVAAVLYQDKRLVESMVMRVE